MQFFEGDENFSWRVLAVESLVIMLSVVLGFTLNGWRESQGEQAAVEAALHSIAAEMRFNRRQLENRLPYYRAMAAAFDSLEAVKGEEAPIDTDEVPGWDGIKYPFLMASSYQAVLSTQALSDMDFGLAKGVARIYALQKLYSEFADKMLTGVMNEEIDRVGEYKEIFRIMAELGQELYTDGYVDLLEEFEERGITAAEAESTAATRTQPQQ